MKGDFTKDIATIKTRYAEFETQRAHKTTWAPFNAEEADVRAQQLLCFARLMREAGYRDLEGMRILDLGCGSGRHLRQFVDMGAMPTELFGIDLDEAAVRRANQISPDIQISMADGDSIAFPKDFFDLVTHHYVFSSVPSDGLRRQLITEVRRVLKPGGLFYWWDMKFMASAAGGNSIALDYCTLLPETPIASLTAAMTPCPSETLRPLPGLRRILGPWIDLLGNEPRFQAALFRLP